MRIGKLLGTVICAACACSMLLGGGTLKNATAETKEKLYSIDEILSPIWEGEIAYHESALPVLGENGEIEPIRLLYPIDEVIEVQNAEMTKTYVAGVDYYVDKGKLWIYPDGAIPMLTHEEMYPLYESAATMHKTDGGYITFHEGSWFHERQIVVTYKHSAKYNGYVPEGKAELLDNIVGKLTAGNTVDMLVFGDSISVGANASGFTGASPYTPIYPQLFAEGLKKTYALSGVNVYNHSVGGKDSTWGVQTIDSVLSQHENIDLAIVAFGMNDGAKSSSAFVANVNQIIAAIKAKFPNADVLAIATMLPNEEAKGFYLNQESFLEALETETEGEGVAVVNMTDVHKTLLERKKYADMTGNNVNHPNDYIARVYAQCLLKTLEENKPTAENKPTTSKTEEGGCASDLGLGMAGAVLAFGATMVALKGKKED